MSTNKAPQQKKAPVIQINQEVLHNNLSDYVRKNLEDVLNELPDAEADRLCHAKRYERNTERASTRAGSYKRNFETTVNFHSKCKILGGVTEFFGKAFLCRFPPENLPRPVVYPVHSLPIQVTLGDS